MNHSSAKKQRKSGVENFRKSFLQSRARRKLIAIDISKSLNDLKVPPSNHLEALTDDRKGQHSIRVNGQWRICFTWENGNAFNVEIVDYH